MNKLTTSLFQSAEGPRQTHASDKHRVALRCGLIPYLRMLLVIGFAVMPSPISAQGLAAETVSYTEVDDLRLLKRTYDQWIDGAWEHWFRTTIDYDDAASQRIHVTQDWIDSEWTNRSRAIVDLNSMNLPVVTVGDRWLVSLWDLSWRRLQAYDLAGRETELLEQDWRNGWVTTNHEVKTYDENGNEVERIRDSSPIGQTATRSRRTSKWNEGNLRTQMIYERWENGEWVNTLRYDWTYNEDDLLIGGIILYWTVDQWANESRSEYTYNESHLAAELVTQVWRNETWTNDRKEVSEYDEAGNRTSLVKQEWSESEWENAARDLISYTPSNQWGEIVSETWVDSAWSKANRRIAQYDVYDNMVEYVGYTWGLTEWIPYERQLSEWIAGSSTSSGVSAPPSKQEIAIESVYPNPTDGVTTILLSGQLLHEGEMVIRDILGREVASYRLSSIGRGPRQVVLNLGQLAAGLYFAEISTDDGLITKSVVRR